MITEVKPKTARYQITEAGLRLRGYDVYSNLESDTGGGIVVYSK